MYLESQSVSKTVAVEPVDVFPYFSIGRSRFDEVLQSNCVFAQTHPAASLTASPEEQRCILVIIVAEVARSIHVLYFSKVVWILV